MLISTSESVESWRRSDKRLWKQNPVKNGKNAAPISMGPDKTNCRRLAMHVGGFPSKSSPRSGYSEKAPQSRFGHSTVSTCRKVCDAMLRDMQK